MADEHQFSVAANGTRVIKFFEACEYGVVAAVEELLQDDGALYKDLQEEETGHSGLHKACLKGQLEVVKVLFAAGSSPNLDDALLQTCLHVAAKAYAEDETGDFCFEDTFVELVKAGALAFQDRDRKLPDVGEDAGSKVTAANDQAAKKGAKENGERQKERKERGMDAFGKAMQKHLTNSSTCVGVVGVKSFSEPGSTGK